MKYIIRLALIISAIQITTNVCTAQNSINAAGGNANGSGGSVAFSVGQVVYTTIKRYLCNYLHGCAANL